MSRHRDFRNINIHDELDDDALSDGGEEMTMEQQGLPEANMLASVHAEFIQAQMNDGLEQVRLIIGNEDMAGLSDDSIKDTLWEYYFNIEKTVQWALDERERRQIAKEKKGDLHEPSPDQHGHSTPYQYYQSNQSNQLQDDGDHQDYPEPEVRSRLPSIFLAQQQPGFDNEAYLSVEDSPYMTSHNRLSTITERTEKTEPSIMWRSRQQYLAPNTARSFQSSPTTSYGQEIVAKEREKALKLSQLKTVASSFANSRAGTPVGSPVKGQKKMASVVSRASGSSTPSKKHNMDQQQLDISGLNLNGQNFDATEPVEEPPKISMAREKLLEEAKRALSVEGNGKRGVSIVVIGHVDAGKSTLMGRLLYELGRLDEKTRRANEKGSGKIGKSSFSWAWGLDGTTEERERGITMDVALQMLATAHRQITVLDAPGHRDFIPNMISGASQADCALLVVDATIGEFESGFQRGGQTREHLLLVRSLGVSQVIVAVNKLDQVSWSKSRYEEICALLRPFFIQSGFQPSKTKFLPVGAMQGINLTGREGDAAADLRQWYSGSTLVDFLDKLEPPAREISAPVRIPLSNVFKSHGSGAAVSGRLCAGVVQVGEKLRILPGDETAVVKSIEIEDASVPWAAAGSNATLYLTAVDPVNLSIGSVLCPPSDLVPLATHFTARIIVFDIQVPIIAGASLEVFHHSREVPANMVKLLSTLDRATGAVLKSNPRVLTKGTSAEVRIVLRSTMVSGTSSTVRIPLETFAANKDMGRILLRRGGETIAAGIVLGINGQS